MTHLKRRPSSAWLRRGPLILKVLFIICIVQIVFTVYVAVRVLKSSLEPDGFVFGGLPSALSDRQRDLAEVLGSLDRLDFQQPVEFVPNEVENKDQPALRKFQMRPLSILDVARHDQELNQLIVSDNKINSEDFSVNASSVSQGPSPSKSSSSKFPPLKMFKIRPIATSDYETTSSQSKVVVKNTPGSNSSSNASQDVQKFMSENGDNVREKKRVRSSQHAPETGRKTSKKSTRNETVHSIEIATNLSHAEIKSPGRVVTADRGNHI